MVAGALLTTGLLALAQGSWNATSTEANLQQPYTPEGTYGQAATAERMMAMPGTVNYIEGQANIDGRALPSGPQNRNTKVLSGQTLATGTDSKAEMLLMPGAVLRLGDSSAVRMVSPMLTNTQVDLIQGTAIVEVARMENAVHLEILDHGAHVVLARKGLYLFNANQPNVAVYDGKAEVQINDRSADVHKGEQLALVSGTRLKTERFNRKQESELYAWSELRSESMAEAAGSAGAYVTAYTPYWAYGPGWYWDPYFDGWLWGPWGYGAGLGFYGGGFYPGLYGRGYFGHGLYGHYGYHGPVAGHVPVGGFHGGHVPVGGFHGGFAGGGFHGGGFGGFHGGFGGFHGGGGRR